MATLPPEIRSYSFGQVEIDGQTYTSDVIILPERIVAGWWRKEGHVLHAADLQDVITSPSKPATLIVGQGAEGRMRVARDAREALQAAGITLIAESMEIACVSYNALRKRETVAAALHLTC